MGFRFSAGEIYDMPRPSFRESVQMLLPWTHDALAKELQQEKIELQKKLLSNPGDSEALKRIEIINQLLV